MQEIVSVDWLNQHILDDNLVLLDASFHKIGEDNSCNSEINSIPGARFFDLKNKFSDTSSAFPNTMHSEEQFEQESQKLGINQDSTLIVFDNQGIYSSPRVWWMFKVMGHKKVSVLNGGLPEWIKQGFSTCKREIRTYEIGNFKANFHTPFVKSYEDIFNNSNIPIIIETFNSQIFEFKLPDNLIILFKIEKLYKLFLFLNILKSDLCECPNE